MRTRTQQWSWMIAVGLMAALALAFPRSEAAGSGKGGWLGVIIQEMTPSMRQALGVRDEVGLLIADVVDDSPAEKSGLQPEDVILKFDGKSVTTARQLARLIRRTRPGREVDLLILRDGKEMTVKVTIGKRPRSLERRFFWSGPGKAIEIWSGRPRLGVQVHELNEDLASYFGVQAYEGVLVLEVTKGSPAEDAGLKAGDIILRVDGEKVRDADELRDILAEYEPGDEVALDILRHGKRRTLTATLEGRRFWEGYAWPRFPEFRFFDDDCDESIIIIRPDLRYRLHQLHSDLQRQKERLKRINPGILVLDELQVI